MKKYFSVFISLLLVLGMFPAQTYAEASGKIKNIIYMIPDGGGYPLYDFSNLVKQEGGFSASIYPYKTVVEKGEMNLKPYLAGSVRTAPHSSSGGITDSAAAGTALATGVKTMNGHIGIDRSKKPRASILEAAQSKGKAAGLIATYEWMHATPASFSAHATSRNDYQNLYQQIENKGLDVVLGAGYGAVSSYGGEIQTAVEHGYQVIHKKSDLENVKPNDKLWGNMANPSLPYDVNLTAEVATLAQMTEAAITALSGDEDGFFLMVEGSKVDSGGHANDAVISTSEYLAFDAAFKVALEFAKGREDTVIVCVPDHDTGGMVFTGKEAMKNEVASVINGSDPATIAWTSTNHTAQNVPVWMYLPEGVPGIDGLNPKLGDTEATRSDYVIENNEIAPYLADLIDVDLDVLTNELFTDVTKIGRYFEATGKFMFANGDKYVYINDSVYYKNGEPISMGGREALYIDNKIYVPAEIIDEEDWNYTIDDEGISGSGTKEDPYIISDVFDMVEFTERMIAGETFSGQYFRQVADIDLSGQSDYKGVGQACTFAGIYDGQAHVVNLNLNTNTDGCLFPYVEGTIMNLGTTGSVTSTGTFAGGIARSVRSKGKLVNCFSTVDIHCANGGGITQSNYGKIVNTYFGGSITGSGKVEAFVPSLTGTCENCYYLLSGSQTAVTGLTGVTEEELTAASFSKKLNDGRSIAAQTLGVETDEILYWTQEAGELPYLYIPGPIVHEVKLTPKTLTLNKGDGFQFATEVIGEFKPSEEVVWSLEPESKCDTRIYEDGYLVIDPMETGESFVVMAKSKQDGSKADTCTVTVSGVVVTEEDGSRARPYLIENEQDFYEFTSQVLSGNKYSGKYLRQTADIDMADYPGYSGMGSGASFEGVYDGGGHTINVKLASKDGCVFPYTKGTLMNIGTTGEIENTTYTGGVCRSIRAGAKMINCWSSCKVRGGSCAGGLTSSNYGLIINCSFFGDAGDGGYPLTISHDGSVTVGNYYLGTEYYEDGQNTEVTQKELVSKLYQWLNAGRIEASALSGLAVSELKYWLPSDEAGPVLASDSEHIIFGLANQELFVYPNVSLNGVDIYVAVYSEAGKLLSLEKETVFAAKKTAYTKPLKHQYSKEDMVKIMLWNGYTPLEASVSY